MSSVSINNKREQEAGRVGQAEGKHTYETIQ